MTAPMPTDTHTPTTLTVTNELNELLTRNPNTVFATEKGDALLKVAALERRAAEMEGLLEDARAFVCVAWSRLLTEGSSYADNAKACITRIDALLGGKES